MSKLYLEYLKRKKMDDSKYYLFKSGMFYVFLSDDEKRISEITTLSIANLNKDVVKCGFPKNSLEKYLKVFNNLGINIEIINKFDNDNNIDINNKIINKIRRINIDNITPVKALNILNDFKGMLDNE